MTVAVLKAPAVQVIFLPRVLHRCDFAQKFALRSGRTGHIVYPPAQPSASGHRYRSRRFTRLAAATALLLTAQAGVALTGQAAAAPAPEDTPASAEATQPSKAEILQG